MSFTESITFFEAYDLITIVVGTGILGISTLIHRFNGRAFSFPIVTLVLGYLAFASVPSLPRPDPAVHGTYIVHLTEIGVTISLMGVGLKIDRPLGLKAWSSAWRLLSISMLITIILTAAVGIWILGLSIPAALLLGAVLSPTDPVLAADVQVAEPQTDSVSERNSEGEEEDEVRFALTAEAGLNDSLAFPFTYLAIMAASLTGPASDWLGQWFLIDVLYRIVVGVGVGTATGWILAKILLKLPLASEIDKMRTGVGALAATLILYGLTEAIGGYGFLAVVVGALTIRHYERSDQSHRSLHILAEQSEQLLLTGILIGLGGAIAGGIFSSITWEAVITAVLLVFVVRPASGVLGLLGTKKVPWRDRIVISFFGIRGIGTLYYLAYATEETKFPEAESLWAVSCLTIVLSIFIHGVTAAPAMKWRSLPQVTGRHARS